MNRKAIRQLLKDIEREVEQLVGEHDINHRGWTCLCVIPDLISRVEAELVPWYSRLWMSVRRRFVQDEIPF